MTRIMRGKLYLVPLHGQSRKVVILIRVCSRITIIRPGVIQFYAYRYDSAKEREYGTPDIYVYRIADVHSYVS